MGWLHDIHEAMKEISEMGITKLDYWHGLDYTKEYTMSEQEKSLETIFMADKIYYSTKELAEAFGVTVSTIRMAKKNGQIEAVRSEELPGRDTYYTQDAIMAYATSKNIKVVFRND